MKEEFDFKKLEAAVKKSGFIIHYVFPKEDSKAFDIHTHGLPDTFDHADLQIVMPIPQQIAHTIIHTIVDMVRAGKEIQCGREYPEVLQGMNVVFAWAVAQERDVLRMILPDQNGVLAKDRIDPEYAYQWEGTTDKPKGLGFR